MHTRGDSLSSAAGSGVGSGSGQRTASDSEANPPNTNGEQTGNTDNSPPEPTSQPQTFGCPTKWTLTQVDDRRVVHTGDTTDTTPADVLDAIARHYSIPASSKIHIQMVGYELNCTRQPPDEYTGGNRLLCTVDMPRSAFVRVCVDDNHYWHLQMTLTFDGTDDRELCPCPACSPVNALLPPSPMDGNRFEITLSVEGIIRLGTLTYSAHPYVTTIGDLVRHVTKMKGTPRYGRVIVIHNDRFLQETARVGMHGITPDSKPLYVSFGENQNMIEAKLERRQHGYGQLPPDGSAPPRPTADPNVVTWEDIRLIQTLTNLPWERCRDPILLSSDVASSRYFSPAVTTAMPASPAAVPPLPLCSRIGMSSQIGLLGIND